MSIAARESAFLSNGLSFSGRAPAQDAGQTVEIERSGHETNWAWTPTVQARIGSNGSFSAVWNTNHIGRFGVRAVLVQSRQSRQNGGANTSSGWPTVTITVYRPSIATWYADNGSTTACGVVLHKNTLGVANRTLPCGTQVALYYKGKTVTVPVIDRGPYANHADWDLTQATAKLLSVYSVGVAHIGAVSLPRRS
jgi:rare lipoprotein A (peptidoglycan hydrolase)